MTITGFVLLTLALVFALTKQTKLFVVSVLTGSVFLIVAAVQTIFFNESVIWLMTLPQPWGTAEMGYTPLSAFFAIIIGFGSSMSVLYGSGYLKKYSREGLSSHLFFLGLLIISMNLTVYLRHSMLFFLAWEMMSLSSFMCILFEHKLSETRKSAIYYFSFMQVSAFFLLIGFGLAYKQTGSFDFGAFQDLGYLPALFIGIGFAIKTGFFPFYSWLPIAYPAAPSHVSGLMSGVMMKTGIYGILLLMAMTNISLTAMYVIAGISLLTAFLGVIHALAESDVKKVIAYSSIENAGIIGLGIAFAHIGLLTEHTVMAGLSMVGLLLHSLNHSLFKPLLFFLSGNISQQTHTREIDQLGGLQKRMPSTGTLFLIGSLAISGMPMFNGFISELFIYLGMLDGLNRNNFNLNIGSILCAAGLTFVGALALFAFVRLYGLVFLGEPRSDKARNAVEVSKSMITTPGILAGLCFLLGLPGSIYLNFFNHILQYQGFWFEITPALTKAFNLVSLVFLIIGILILIMLILRRRIVKEVHPTWGCGYEKPSSRMQYTGNSMIHPLAYFIKPFIKKQDVMNYDKALFPESFTFEAKVHDFIHETLITPVKKAVLAFLNLFAGIQKGNTQVYISYGLVFLLIVLTWAILVVK
ncbi:MAG: hypothetical protein JXR56_01120 [Candidatus Cloacimonetes bacterium]|nr:hypothetical protein [Candidatus Cloacimonadota bacterium]